MFSSFLLPSFFTFFFLYVFLSFFLSFFLYVFLLFFLFSFFLYLSLYIYSSLILSLSSLMHHLLFYLFLAFFLSFCHSLSLSLSFFLSFFLLFSLSLSLSLYIYIYIYFFFFFPPSLSRISPLPLRWMSKPSLPPLLLTCPSMTRSAEAACNTQGVTQRAWKDANILALSKPLQPWHRALFSAASRHGPVQACAHLQELHGERSTLSR